MPVASGDCSLPVTPLPFSHPCVTTERSKPAAEEQLIADFGPARFEIFSRPVALRVLDPVRIDHPQQVRLTGMDLTADELILSGEKVDHDTEMSRKVRAKRRLARPNCNPFPRQRLRVDAERECKPDMHHNSIRTLRSKA